MPTELSPDPELLRQHSDSIVLRLLQISTLTPPISIQQPVLTGSEFAVPPRSLSGSPRSVESFLCERFHEYLSKTIQHTERDGKAVAVIWNDRNDQPTVGTSLVTALASCRASSSQSLPRGHAISNSVATTPHSARKRFALPLANHWRQLRYTYFAARICCWV
ncbi:hypothetical protein B0H13DRAFT_1922894 [Mycena leptocephala]|nr:hypothetical protein B0H13DRAFT_1922894 [Mycena leptocephala]